MNGQVRTFREKQNIVEQFIASMNPYEKQQNIHFDLRAYAKFVEENNISASEVTNEILNKFCLPTK